MLANMPDILVTLLVFQLLRLPIDVSAVLQNIRDISVTLLVFQLLRSPTVLRLSVSANMRLMLVTLLVSHESKPFTSFR